MNILITAANSALAHQLKNKLHTGNIIMGDYQDLPAFMLKSGKMILLPNPASATYTHEMLTICLDKDINTIYVLRDQERELLIKAEQLFKEYSISIKAGNNEI